MSISAYYAQIRFAARDCLSAMRLYVQVGGIHFLQFATIFLGLRPHTPQVQDYGDKGQVSAWPSATLLQISCKSVREGETKSISVKYSCIGFDSRN